MKGNKLYILIGIIIALLCVGLGIGFAFFFGIQQTVDNSNINIRIAPGSSFSVEYSDDISMSLDILPDDLLFQDSNNNYTSYTSNNKTVTIDFEVDNNSYANGGYCNYDVIYTPDIVYTQSAGATNANLNELVISGVSNLNHTISDYNISGLSDPTVIYTGRVSANSSFTPIKEIWTMSMKFYNLNVNQDSIMGSSAGGKISFETKDCEAYES